MKKYLVICLSVMLLVSVLMIPASAAGELILFSSDDGLMYLAEQAFSPGDYTISFEYIAPDGNSDIVESKVFTVPESYFLFSSDGIDVFGAEVQINFEHSLFNSTNTFTFMSLADKFVLCPLSVDELESEVVPVISTSVYALKPVAKTPSFVENVTTDVSTVFSGALGMVKKVAEVFTSNPILYLPIVIGLCGIGVAFYKRLRQ